MKKTNFQKLKKLLPGLQKNISLKKHTTFKIGGSAKYFLVVEKKEDLIAAVKMVKEVKMPFYILGGGSNVLISDKGFKGLVIKNEAGNFEIRGQRIIAESGAILGRVIEFANKAGLSGLEKGSGIPGTLGGAVYGNAGWPKGDWEIGNFVKEVELLMPQGQIKRVGKRWLSFGYRNSRLKKMKNPVGKSLTSYGAGKNPVILEVVLGLKKGKSKDLEKKRQEILIIRRKKVPSGFSAGSVFKNPAGKTAGFLIEKCGLKGKKEGRAQISTKHANFIINSGGAKARDVIKLIKLAKRKVKTKFGINLEEEIQIII